MTNISVSSGTTTSASCPNPAPASVVIANISYATTSIAPNPMPEGMVVDFVADLDAESGTYPADGNYVGEVIKHGKLY